MRVLVGYVSKHGSTREIATVVATQIQGALTAHHVPCTVDLRQIHEATDPTPYDAVVLGSPVYFGQWLDPMQDFVRRHRDELAVLRVWLFDSGSVSEPGPGTCPPSLSRVGPLSFRHFGGCLRRAGLGRWERIVVGLLRADDVDNRSMDDVADWARSIGRALATTPVER